MIQNLLKTHAIRSRKTGFTLVETLVAITVLLLVIIGPMTVAQKGVQNAYFANDQTTAVFLAQEAIEGIRAVRDNKALDAWLNTGVNTETWIDDVKAMNSDCVTNGTGSVNRCGYEPQKTGSDAFVSDCNGGPTDIRRENCRLYLTQGGVYTYEDDNSDPNNTKTKFFRFIQIHDEGNGKASIIVTVEWESNILGNKEVVLKTWIYDQYKRYSS